MRRVHHSIRVDVKLQLSGFVKGVLQATCWGESEEISGQPHRLPAHCLPVFPISLFFIPRPTQDNATVSVYTFINIKKCSLRKYLKLDTNPNKGHHHRKRGRQLRTLSVFFVRVGRGGDKKIVERARIISTPPKPECQISKASKRANFAILDHF